MILARGISHSSKNALARAVCLARLAKLIHLVKCEGAHYKGALRVLKILRISSEGATRALRGAMLGRPTASPLASKSILRALKILSFR